MTDLCPVCGEDHAGQSGGTWCIQALARKVSILESTISNMQERLYESYLANIKLETSKRMPTQPDLSVAKQMPQNVPCFDRSAAMKEVWRKRKGAERD